MANGKRKKDILMDKDNFVEKFKEWEEEGKMSYLPVGDMKPLHLYKIHARNASHGIWHPERKVFVISRFKFTDNFLCSEVHWDLSDHFGTAKPLKELTLTPFTLEDLDNRNPNVKEYLNNYDKIRCEECGRYKNEWIRHEEWCTKRKEI